jgi:hypothetical protein
VLKIDSIIPYNSVTDQVYNELVPDANKQYKLTTASQNADSILIKLKDEKYTPGVGNPLLRGTLDVASAKVLLVAVAFMDNKEFNLDGVKYFKITLNKDQLPFGYGAYMYNISGMKYQVSSTIFDVESMQVVFLPN